MRPEFGSGQGTLEGPGRLERFFREAKAAARLRHPHIVPVFEAGSIQGQYYIASAFVDGKTLAQAIQDETVNFRRAARRVCQLAEALAYAHGHNVIHRDVKSANVIVDASGQAHLLDFGLAYRQALAEKLTHDGAILGTPSYMAPEQAKGQQGEPLPAA